MDMDPGGTIGWLKDDTHEADYDSFRSRLKTMLVREMNRASFSLRKISYDDLLGRIRNGIGSLELLTVQNMDLGPSRRAGSNSRYLTILRASFGSVYRALESGLNPNCHSIGHAVQLALESREADIMPHEHNTAIAREFSFRISIAHHQGDENMNTTMSCNNVLIREKAAAQTLAMSTPHPHAFPVPPHHCRASPLCCVPFRRRPKNQRACKSRVMFMECAAMRPAFLRV